MACNENIIKNVATEVTSNCQAQNVNIEIEFVGFLIDLLLLNPKYGKQFAKNLNRRKLEYFVDECVAMLISEFFSLDEYVNYEYVNIHNITFHYLLTDVIYFIFTLHLLTRQIGEGYAETSKQKYISQKRFMA